ncbi:CbbQ/NirQ/NorQ/GpvN family protein [Amphibiibacter pelophylacis]|uniref:CbbQ/NirQ/NorQ/GpvN family protein n=1 Tax=Amphibiibacter pelophylacis TaxID=1799477 RepID=A0ACC6P4I9_9BURK
MNAPVTDSAVSAATSVPTASLAQRLDAEPWYRPQGDELAQFSAAAAAGLPVMLKGPTGCGKSRLVEHMAWRLGRPLVTVACNEDMTAADLVGRFLLDATGTRWQDGPLAQAARLGAVCYLDEVVEARADTTVVIHALTDHRRSLPMDKKGELLQAHPDFLLVISFNPGYQNLSKELKPSTRQRFVALDLDYPDAATEAAIVSGETGLDADRAARLVQIAQASRRLRGQGLREGMSTRLLVYAARLLLQGLPWASACRTALVQPVSDDATLQQALLDTVMALGEPASAS